MLAPATADAFRDAAIGDAVKNRRMPTLDGRTEMLLAPAKANVFVFFRAGQDHSAEALAQMAKLEAELAAKPVRFVAVVSAGDPPGDVRAMVKATGIRMPVLLDEGDALYGELGVSLHPSIGIADAAQRLAAYQPFRKVNFLDLVRARVQRVLGEIGDAQLAAVVDPPPAPVAVNRSHARVNLARKLLAAGAVEAALQSARRSVGLEPESGEAHAVLAEALARSGKCEEARREAGEARRLGAAGARVMCAGR
ncbi:MAG TPA: redoxin family protein [Anaeromyxobacter sp.]|nr:redoxin family protein [Anaeromyxobacter sp.]